MKIIRACFMKCMKKPSKKAFTHIYKEAIWGTNEEGNGTSGYGSTLHFNTKYIDFMKKFIDRYNIQTIVDIGCGDWQFSNYIYYDRNVEYYGYDCVKHIIKKNKKDYSMVKSYHFECIDGEYILDGVNTCADLLIMKDVLQHWTNNMIIDFIIDLFNNSNYKYILITNDHTTSTNIDIKLGEYRQINWKSAPFDSLHELYEFTEIFSFDNLDNKTTMLLTPK